MNARLVSACSVQYDTGMDLEPGSPLLMLLITSIAAAAMPLGGWLALIGNLRPGWLEQELRHSILAFGGGALLAAVALVLVPEGAKGLSAWAICLWFLAGGACFMLLDVWLAKRKTSASQMAAMMADFLPESLAMGAAFAKGHATGFSLALLIALQNVPEGFNAFREMAGQSRVRGHHILRLMVCLVPLGPLMGWLGMSVLASYPLVLGSIMMFASGGILYAIFQDIAPQVPLSRHWAPPMGAVAGFLVGLLGYLWISG